MFPNNSDIIVRNTGPNLQRGLRGRVVRPSYPREGTPSRYLIDLEPNRDGLYGGQYWFESDEIEAVESESDPLFVVQDDLLRRLFATGWNDEEICRRVGVTKQALDGWRRGVDPSRSRHKIERALRWTKS